MISAVVALAGLVLVSAGVVAWTGRWRRWAVSDAWDPLRVAPITLVPGVGVFLLAIGVLPLLGPSVGGEIALGGFLAAIGSWVLALAQPAWWGPRWWREQNSSSSGDEGSGVAAVLRAGRVPPERDSEFLVLAERAPLVPGERRPVVLLDAALGRPTLHHRDGAAPGALLFFDDEVVFAACHRDDATRPGPTIRVMPAAAVVGIARAGSSVTVTVRGDGGAAVAVVFESSRARGLAVRLRRM